MQLCANNNTSSFSLNTDTSSHPGKELLTFLGTKKTLNIFFELNNEGMNVQLTESSHDYIGQWTLKTIMFVGA